MTLKGRRFSSTSEVIENATVELNKLRKIDFYVSDTLSLTCARRNVWPLGMHRICRFLLGSPLPRVKELHLCFLSSCGIRPILKQDMLLSVTVWRRLIESSNAVVHLDEESED
ncbi:hypothetical protein LAZ67_19001021 [Cordylochernes scorpioides]|uniref:Uncharacterized protein n=1 Tax=Cordylochernes scorpioides TaxID=51811 RepID=A0ABY6LJ02_9ARAC|nr:hypothetical protein LAZ67_19001021 [Cordylochernes scorpioides]